MAEAHESERCVICHNGFAFEDNSKVCVGEKGISSLLNYCEIRENTIIAARIKNRVESNWSIYVHKNCRRDFTDKKRSFKKLEEKKKCDEPKRKLLRSSIETCDLKSQCFLCGQQIMVDPKNPERNQVHNVTLLEFHRAILEKCRKRNDKWGDEVHKRLNCTNDLVADEGKYHKTCLQRFLLDRKSPDQDAAEKGRPVDERMSHWFEILCLWLEIDSNGELYTLQELHSKMLDLAGHEDVYCAKRLKQKLLEKYGDRLHFAEVDGKSNVLCFRGMVDYFLNELWKEERQKDREKDAERIVVTAAKVIMAEIREKKCDTSIYPSTTEIRDTADESIPKLLKTFLQVLIRPELKQKSIGQAIVQAAKPKSAIMPILFGLAVELDHVFGSKWLLDELYQLGFCSTYTEVSRFKQSAMVTEDATQNELSFQPGTFSQHVADNVDHNLCTLDGKNTFHGMGIIQVSSSNDTVSREEKSIKRFGLKRVSSVTENKGIPIEQYIEESGNIRSTIVFKALGELKFNFDIKLQRNIDLLWEMSFLFTEASRPGWSGFMQVYRKGSFPGKSEITLLPIINLNPNDNSCIYSTLLFIIGQAKKTNTCSPCITFDQPLWLKAVQIITEKSLHILCRLGGFHTLMSYLGSIGNSMKGSGISQCLQVVYGENAVKHMVSGKAIARALRGHFLLQSALRLQIIKQLTQEEIISQEDLQVIKTSYQNFIKNQLEHTINFELMERLSCDMEQKMGSLSACSRTAKLWVQYIHCIDTVKSFIAAERTGNWQNHLGATAQMLNLFAATGHLNYAKSARLYLQMMSDLPSTFPDLHEQFSNHGYHVVRRSDRYWSGIWTDLSIEQVLMRSLKTRGGLTRGRGMSENVMLTWVHTMHICAQIHFEMTQLTGNYHRTSQQHAELGASRIKRDNNDFRKIQLWIEDHSPFDENQPLLRNIATGLTATENDGINCDDAEKVGKVIQDKLDDITFADAVIKKKDQIKTLQDLEMGVKIQNDKIHIDPLLLFTRLLVLIEREEEIRSYFRFELTAYPTALFENGMMRKAIKSKLGQALKKDISPKLYKPNEVFHVLDGGALLHKVKWLPGKSYQLILEQYSRYIKKKYGRACIVFDGYGNGPSTKDHEHKRRAGRMCAHVNLDNIQMVPTCNQEVFLKNDQNKAHFISLLSEELRKEGHDVRNSIWDADTQIVSAALDFASDHGKEVVVVAADTDILVLLMFHWKDEMQIYMLADTSGKEMWKVEELVKASGDKIANHILFIHAWTGCDTTSATYGKGSYF